jgi:hypothetical protein
MYRSVDTPSGAALGEDDYGRPILAQFIPNTTFRAIQRYRGYFGPGPI